MTRTVQQQILQELKQQPGAGIFLYPVDPILNSCPDYHSVVLNPMDITTLSNMDIDDHDFCHWVMTIFSNACLYNPPNHPVYHSALLLANWFNSKVLNIWPEKILNWQDYKIDLSRKRSVNFSELDPTRKKRKSISSDKELSSLASTLETMNQQIEMLSQPSKKKKYSEIIQEPKTKKIVKPVQEKIVKEKVVKEKVVKEKVTREKPPPVQRVCDYCHTTETPMWRRGPSGKSTLCNKCGVKWRAGRILKHPDGTILQPPSPTTLSRSIKAIKANPRQIQQAQKRRVTYAQKKHLANLLSLGVLPTHHLAHIINMIRSSMPDLKNAKEEIELDIEAMDTKLVQEMYQYVTKVAGIKPADEAIPITPPEPFEKLE